MPNKIYGDVVQGYLVEGAGKSGYVKNSNKGYGDGNASTPNTNYDSKQGVGFSTDGWFEGKKSSKGSTVSR